ncbi:MAG TPA: hypothetical protein VNG51_28840 [Ktedonobacteraceae bacterium]|nr:hypothetical protein [Ktedonobacteraceae bacterium]
MDYQYENLDSGRFQELCQSLLIKEYPNVQCFPIGQQDGGRDAVVYYQSSKDKKEFIVFQIKQVKHQPDQPHKWLKDILQEEAPKVSKLIPKGAKAYYLLTNVRGTAHLDVGSIDKVNKILSDVIEIPSTCWWRDDINRRLDNSWDLKWAYPEIITALDMLRYLLENGLTEDRHKLISVIEAFVQVQYSKDEVVRFKQGGLIQSKLLDLFIDVPIQPTDNQEGRHQAHFLHNIMRNYGEVDDLGLSDQPLTSLDSRYMISRERRHSLGAAVMLFHPIVQQEVPLIVLEGAPGQGKSTIVQFVCQMYRMRILKENMDAIPSYHRPSSLRIPIKIDLRDYATWLDGQDPFSSEEQEGKPEGWYKSLEAFLAYQIRYDSGWAPFSVSDLHTVAKLSSLLLVLDGFDEVADISKRQEVVTEVTTCAKRLKTIAASLQVIVTSRPAAFANSPGFSAFQKSSFLTSN